MSLPTLRFSSPHDLAASLTLQAIDDPLVVVDTMEAGEPRVGKLVDDQLAGELALSYGLRESLEVGLSLPVVISSTTGSTPVGQAESGGALGDLRLIGRARLSGGLDPGLGIGARLEVGLPTATGADFAGAPTPTVAGTIVGEWRFDFALLAANVGGRLRESQTFENLKVGPSFLYGLGGAVDVGTSALAFVGELAGETAGSDEAETALEGRLGLRWRSKGPIGVSAGYGRGLLHGWGAPDHRALVTVAFRTDYQPRRRLVAVMPVLPSGPPPDPDPDKDGITTDDHCPNDPEDKDDFEDQDGCPELDNDKDTIADKDDTCPLEPEDLDKYQDEDGCPDADNDNDGLADLVDRCRNEAEIINGFEDDDGCPDAGRQLVVVTAKKLEIREQLYFAHDKDEILPRSEPVLEQLALTLKRSPWIKRVRIEGHTDDAGNDAYNKDLSGRRAASVLKALLARGVAADRLESQGYGEEQPIDTNKTPVGRANNRRVEFVILDQVPPPGGAAPTTPATQPAGGAP